jgi:hypothetical protein
MLHLLSQSVCWVPQLSGQGEPLVPPALACCADVGKSTLCKILLNYAVRAGWAPTFADMDIGQGSITVPGCIAATPGAGRRPAKRKDAVLLFHRVCSGSAQATMT